MRTEKELVQLLYDLKGFYERDFGSRYTTGAIDTVLAKMLENKVYDFLKRRIGHLPDVDFLRFFKIFLDDANGRIIPPEEPKPVIEQIPEPAKEVVSGKSKVRKQARS